MLRLFFKQKCGRHKRPAAFLLHRLRIVFEDRVAQRLRLHPKTKTSSSRHPDGPSANTRLQGNITQTVESRAKVAKAAWLPRQGGNLNHATPPGTNQP